MNESKRYPGGRSILYKEGYALILPESYKDDKMPLFCEVCEISFSRQEDEKSYKLFKCCSTCADTWAYSHRQDWEKGWRPSQEQIKVATQKRLFVNPNIVFE